MSGGRRVVQGRDRLAVAGGLVVRALPIGAIGLALGMLAQESIALAVAAQLTSALLLYPLGGLGVLVAQSDSGGSAAAVELLWEQSSPTPVEIRDAVVISDQADPGGGR